MKKSIAIVLLTIITGFTYAQDDKQKSTTINFSGGLWTGFNKSTTFIGFVGPKIAITFPVNSKTKVELGINGIPGATIEKNPRFGLAIGSTLTLKQENWKMKPIIGCALLKTDKWQTIYGVGFLF